jgi:hypothetical protein
MTANGDDVGVARGRSDRSHHHRHRRRQLFYWLGLSRIYLFVGSEAGYQHPASCSGNGKLI